MKEKIVQKKEVERESGFINMFQNSILFRNITINYLMERLDIIKYSRISR